MAARAKPIIRGADWRQLFEFHYPDAGGNTVKLDWLNYTIECDFKYAQGVDKPLTVKPDIAVIADSNQQGTLLQLSLTEAQTTELEVADIYFNILATAPYQQQRRDNSGAVISETKLWTAEAVKGKIKVLPGVTDPTD